jgi:cytochrome c-type biogenesis protein CcmH
MVAALFCLAAAPEQSERLADPVQEARARVLFREVRCLVCQNESIDDSQAGLAGDLRRIVREQVAAGRSDRDVRAFLTDRYGEFVLLKPRFSLANAALWLTPILVLAAGGLLFGLLMRRRSQPAPLSPQEESRLAVLMASRDD